MCACVWSVSVVCTCVCGGGGGKSKCLPVFHVPGLVAGVAGSGEASDQTLHQSSCSSPACVESPESSARV